MKDYKKPMIISMGASEGVYLASGDGDSECYTAWVTVDQYDTDVKRFHVYTTHDTTSLDGHHSHGQHIVVTFSNPLTEVTFVEGNQLQSWSYSGNTLTIYAGQHANHNPDTTSWNFGAKFSDCGPNVKPATPTAVCYDTAHHKQDHSDF